MENVKKQCFSCNEKKCRGCHTFSNWEPGKVQCWMCSEFMFDSDTMTMGDCPIIGKRIKESRKICNKFKPHLNFA